MPRRSLFKKPAYVHAVQGVSFDIKKGLIYGLVGESGCGKSTLSRLIAGVEQLTKGKIIFRGTDIVSLLKNNRTRKQMCRHIQLILQDASASLPPNMRVAQILTEPLEIHRIGSVKERIEKLREVLETVRLNPSILEGYPSELSGGVQQKINIARALMLDVGVLISDESISGLDPVSQAEIMNLYLELNQKNKLTMIFIAHDISTVWFLCDVVIVMYLGKCVEIANNEDLFNSSLHPYTRALIKALPTIEKGLKNKGMYVLKGEVPSPVTLPLGCNFYSRCPNPAKDEECRTKKPLLKEYKKNHRVACFKLKD